MAARKNQIKPTQKAVKVYYAEMKALADQGVEHEQAVRQPFATLLTETAKTRKWTLVAEQSVKVSGKRIIPDGTFRDDLHRRRGYWEAKDIADDLDKAIRSKIKQGYPTTNIIFQTPERGVLYQNGIVHDDADLTDPKQLVRLLNEFYAWEEPNIEKFDQAIDEFSEQVAELGKGLIAHIDAAHKDNENFKKVYGEFYDLCKKSLNPNLSRDAVNEMLAQHLLTERVIRTLFDRQDFVRRNVIAKKVEEVIEAMTSKSFSRQEYLKSLNRFYVAIEDTGRDLEDFSEKQHFLNRVYERFFQGFSVKIADTHGIVYTPQEIVDFMCASVEHVLKEEFNQTLGSDEVVVLDPCTGTGNFIVNLMKRVDKGRLKDFYTKRLFANEVMLMPYYIAGLNIEHAYYERMKEYQPFDGLCFVDTLDMAEHAQGQFEFMTEKNAERVETEKDAPITVIIGNPPYNMGQVNENDNNKNRPYEVIDGRIKETYAKDSRATLKTKLYDAYVKFFRWATDRLNGRDGVVCFVSNNSFVENIAFDGMRKHLAKDFDRLHVFDLKGNIRKDSMRDGIPLGEKNTVFGLAAMVGISIAVLVKSMDSKSKGIHYVDVPFRSTRDDKFATLRTAEHVGAVTWKTLYPSKVHTWLGPKDAAAFCRFLPLGLRAAGVAGNQETIIVKYGPGVNTARDSVVYDYDRERLTQRVQRFINDYNAEVDRYRRLRGKPGFDLNVFDVDDFVKYDRIKWSRDLKQELVRARDTEFYDSSVREALYRPFCKRWLYYAPLMTDSPGLCAKAFPTTETEVENSLICISGIGGTKPPQCMIVSGVADFHLTGETQCFPFYVYDKDGSNRRENVTDWALNEFRAQYKNNKITKWDIFYYIYGILHHPGYREKYGDCLKRELPRLPYAPDFKAFSTAGKKLAALHLEYEEIKPYDLKKQFDDELPPSYVVDKMRLAKDKKTLVVNDSLTLSGIPPETFEYRLGNRSALDWVIDQYRVKVDKRSGIKSDPNRKDDDQYIVRLVGQVVQVSLDTVEIVNGLPDDFGG